MSEYLFYIVVGVLIFAVLGAAYVWKEGLLGTATEARIKKLRDAAKAQVAHWEQELSDKIAANKAKEAAGVPTLSHSVDKLETVAAWAALLDKGRITQAQFEAQRDALLK